MIIIYLPTKLLEGKVVKNLGKVRINSYIIKFIRYLSEFVTIMPIVLYLSTLIFRILEIKKRLIMKYTVNLYIKIIY